MSKGPKGRKSPAATTKPSAKGGAPRTGNRSRKEGKDEKPSSFADFLEHPGSVGEMHFSYEKRKKRPRR